MKVQCVSAAGAQLGEGTLWDPARRCVWWVDIRSATLHAHNVAPGANHIQRLEHRLTALGHARAGGMVASGDQGFVRLEVAADLTVHVAAVLAQPREPAGNRFNDGKVDPAGRFWAGTMDDAEATARGSLYRLDAHGLARVRTTSSCPTDRASSPMAPC